MEAGTYFVQAEWARAKEALDVAAATGLSSPEFEALSKKVTAAANPPEGFVYVPAGKFPFGSGGAESATGPEQEVETEAFYISKREVSNGEYKKFLDAYKDHSRCHPEEPAEKKELGHVPQDWNDAGDPAKPVVGVDWFDAWAYSRWAGGRLPSEVEWEKAAGWDPRSGKKSTYPWGDDFVTGKGGPSPNGAEGMGSGVLEWIEDWYEPYPGSKADDLDFGKKRRVARGGVFLREEEVEDLKVIRRFRFLPDRRDRSLGFRIVKATP
jgi:formylglycine-generating enzyme required for sulfatase activity